MIAIAPHVDKHRRVPVTVLPDIDEAPPLSFGAIEVRTRDGNVWGYANVCPGCGMQSYLPLAPHGDASGWRVTAGDPAHPETVTLSPSVYHKTPYCDWHGYLRNGVWEPL